MTFRHIASKQEWAAIAAEKSGLCRGCGTWPVTFHHLVSRSLGGDDTADNIIPLCGDGTSGCHGALENHPSYWRAVAANVRESLTPEELVYVLQTKGMDWLDRYLPGPV